MPWHPGELKMKVARGYKDQVAGIEFDKEMPVRHRQLYPLLLHASTIRVAVSARCDVSPSGS